MPGMKEAFIKRNEPEAFPMAAACNMFAPATLASIGVPELRRRWPRRLFASSIYRRPHQAAANWR